MPCSRVFQKFPSGESVLRYECNGRLTNSAVWGLYCTALTSALLTFSVNENKFIYVVQSTLRFRASHGQCTVPHKIFMIRVSCIVVQPSIMWCTYICVEIWIHILRHPCMDVSVYSSTNDDLCAAWFVPACLQACWIAIWCDVLQYSLVQWCAYCNVVWSSRVVAFDVLYIGP